MDNTASLMIFLSVCFVFGCAYLAWREYLKKQMGEKGFYRVVRCRIFYRGKKLWDRVYTPGRQGIRVGFSADSKYRNDIKIERILESHDEVDDEDLREFSPYGTWFRIWEQKGKLMIEPSYLSGENVLGHKKIYTDQGLLRDEGEPFGTGRTIFGKSGKDSPWKITVYDEYYQDTEREEEEV